MKEGKTMKKMLSLLLSGVMVASMLTGYADKGGTPSGQSSSDSNKPSNEVTETTKLTLAASIPITGNLMQYGISYKNALTMAVNDFIAAGGINDKDVVLQMNDDKGDQKEAINLANKIIENKDVFAVIGSFGSSVSMAAAPVYQKAGMPMVSPNTSHPDFPSMGDMLVPISPDRKSVV